MVNKGGKKLKRDFDLILHILRNVQIAPAGERAERYCTLDGYDEATIGEHLALIVKAGLAEGQIVQPLGA